MALPKKFDLMLPLLNVVARGQISIRDAASALAKEFKLSAAEQAEMLSTGNKTRFFDRVSWARVYLRQAGLVDLPARGQIKITSLGKKLLLNKPPRIDIHLLMEYPKFRQFIARSEKDGRYINDKMGVVSVPEEKAEADIQTNEATLHTEIQYKLIYLGISLGLKVWVARNDRSRSFNGVKFSNIKEGLLDKLPNQFDRATQRTIELIDILWMEKKSIIAAFEIESTTSIYSGLLRMSDLAAMQPNISIKLFIVAPDERRSKVFQEINRPTFSRFSPTIAEMCKFLSFEKLSRAIHETRSFTKHLNPDFLDDVAEVCEVSED